jgi:hypothetical protein
MAPSRRAVLAALAATGLAACGGRPFRDTTAAPPATTGASPAARRPPAGTHGSGGGPAGVLFTGPRSGRRVAAGLHPGAIVSLHTGHAGTVAALGPILAAVRARGLVPVPLHRLLAGPAGAPG